MVGRSGMGNKINHVTQNQFHVLTALPSEELRAVQPSARELPGIRRGHSYRHKPPLLGGTVGSGGTPHGVQDTSHWTTGKAVGFWNS